VVWNFPCVRASGGRDGQASELQANQALLCAFFRTVPAVLRGPASEVSAHV
jgi:hypothetical protein